MNPKQSRSTDLFNVNKGIFSLFSEVAMGQKRLQTLKWIRELIERPKHAQKEEEKLRALESNIGFIQETLNGDSEFRMNTFNTIVDILIEEFTNQKVKEGKMYVRSLTFKIWKERKVILDESKRELCFISKNKKKGKTFNLASYAVKWVGQKKEYQTFSIDSVSSANKYKHMLFGWTTLEGSQLWYEACLKLSVSAKPEFLSLQILDSGYQNSQLSYPSNLTENSSDITPITPIYQNNSLKVSPQAQLGKVEKQDLVINSQRSFFTAPDEQNGYSYSKDTQKNHPKENIDQKIHPKEPLPSQTCLGIMSTEHQEKIHPNEVRQNVMPTEHLEKIISKEHLSSQEDSIDEVLKQPNLINHGDTLAHHPYEQITTQDQKPHVSKEDKIQSNKVQNVVHQGNIEKEQKIKQIQSDKINEMQNQESLLTSQTKNVDLKSNHNNESINLNNQTTKQKNEETKRENEIHVNEKKKNESGLKPTLTVKETKQENQLKEVDETGEKEISINSLKVESSMKSIQLFDESEEHYKPPVILEFLKGYRLETIKDESNLKTISFNGGMRFLQNTEDPRRFKIFMAFQGISAFEVFNCVCNTDEYTKWNNNVSETRVLNIMRNEQTAIIYQKHKGIGIMYRPRDFVYLRYAFVQKDTYFLIDKSIEYESLPGSIQIVRGEIEHVVWSFQTHPADEKRTLLIADFFYTNSGYSNKDQDASITFAYLNNFSNLTGFLAQKSFSAPSNINMFDIHQIIIPKNQEHNYLFFPQVFYYNQSNLIL